MFRRAFFLCECFCLTVKNSFRAREPRARHVSRARDFNIKPYTALSNYSIQRVTPPAAAAGRVRGCQRRRRAVCVERVRLATRGRPAPGHAPGSLGRTSALTDRLTQRVVVTLLSPHAFKDHTWTESHSCDRSAAAGLRPPGPAIRCSTASTGSGLVEEVLDEQADLHSLLSQHLTSTTASALRVAALSHSIAGLPPPPPRPAAAFHSHPPYILHQQPVFLAAPIAPASPRSLCTPAARSPASGPRCPAAPARRRSPRPFPASPSPPARPPPSVRPSGSQSAAVAAAVCTLPAPRAHRRDPSFVRTCDYPSSVTPRVIIFSCLSLTVAVRHEQFPLPKLPLPLRPDTGPTS